MRLPQSRMRLWILSANAASVWPDQLVEIIPIGADRNDHAAAQRYGKSLITPADDIFQVAYLGTLTERMLPALGAFLSAATKAQLGASKKLIIHLIGTSAQPNGSDQHNLTALIEKTRLNGKVFLHPARIGYLDALRTMQDADLLLLIGSTDSHYTASKFFPYWLSGKPVLGLFHPRSTIVSLSDELGGAMLVLYDEEHAPETKIGETAAILSDVVRSDAVVPARYKAAFAPYSAEGIAARYAEVFNRVSGNLRGGDFDLTKMSESKNSYMVTLPGVNPAPLFRAASLFGRRVYVH